MTETRSKEYDINNHRKILPAATVEVYSSDDTTLCSIQPQFIDIIKIWSLGNMKNENNNNNSKKDIIVDAAIQRFRNTFTDKDNILPDFPHDYSPPVNTHLIPLKRMEIDVFTSETKLDEDTDESYELTIETEADDYNESYKITLRSMTVFGTVRGFETLIQLIEFGWLINNQATTASPISTIQPMFVIRNAPLTVADTPSFAYRGLMIDTSRHYLPMGLILENLNIMAMNKLNILHWHLTDSQSFPFQSPSLPELSEKGAYHPKLIYTAQDIQKVVHEAYLRGIRVIPEIDMPGHTNAIVKSHPELMSTCPDPSEPLDPTNPKVYELFVESIYKDLNDLFPDSYVHVGGDEVGLDCWNNSKPIRNWMSQHNMTNVVELFQYFETRLLQIVNDHYSKTPIVWQEVFNENLTLSPNTIVDVWKGFDRQTLEQATNQSFRVLLSGCWYLDHLDDTWSTFYNCNPRDFNGKQDLLLGGHASMWAEHVDASNFISRVWPRASAVAERLWTGNVTGPAQDSIRERIHKFRCRLIERGVPAGPTEPGYCPKQVPYRPIHSNSNFKNRQFDVAM